MVSMLGCLCLHFCLALVQAPRQYPDIWPVLVSVFSCAHFIGFFCYFNYIQFCLPYAARPVAMKGKIYISVYQYISIIKQIWKPMFIRPTWNQVANRGQITVIGCCSNIYNLQDHSSRFYVRQALRVD